MPIPLIPILAALAAGGTLVPHAAGGLIVTTTGGYVAGTYLSTAAVSSVLIGSGSALAAGTAVVAGVVTGATASVIGSAGIFGTTIGATGITGFLMQLGILSSTPIWVPAAIVGAAGGLGYGAYKYYKLREKLKVLPAGQEANFTEKEAKFIERLLLRAPKSLNA